MDKRTGMSRRGFGKWVAAVAGGTAAGIGGVKGLSLLGPEPRDAWMTLTDGEVRTLGAVAEQIVPTDRDPGAKEARVTVYIDRQLAKDAPYEAMRGSYREWLSSLDAVSLGRSKKSFADLSWPEQTRLLQEVEAGKVPKKEWTGKVEQTFFRNILNHVKQGFYGSPVHGGNFNYVSYRMLGLSAPSCVGRNRLS